MMNRANYSFGGVFFSAERIILEKYHRFFFTIGVTYLRYTNIKEASHRQLLNG